MSRLEMGSLEKKSRRCLMGTARWHGRVERS